MKIIGTGSALPKREVTNDELAAFLDTSDEWIRSKTGIATRRLLSDDTIDELAVRAAQNALSMAKLAPGAIDYLLCCNVVSPYQTPGLGSVVQRQLSLSCPTIDMNAACSGFVYALELADGLLQAGNHQTIMILCAESNSSLVDWGDRASCILFGDGAAAVILQKSASPDRPVFRMTAQPDDGVLLARNHPGNSPFLRGAAKGHFLKMDGPQVYKFAVMSSLRDIKALLAKANLSAEDIAYFLMHQANERIIDSIRAKLALPWERFPTNVQRYGNTSSASIPLLIDELSRGGALKEGDRLLLSAFGAGLLTGACLLTWHCD